MSNKNKLIIIGIILSIVVVLAFVASLPPGINGNTTDFSFGNFLLNIGQVFIGLFSLFLFFVLYFLPAFLASRRQHKNAPAITVLNLFLGWTFLGWIIALIWSLTANTSPVS